MIHIWKGGAFPSRFHLDDSHGRLGFWRRATHSALVLVLLQHGSTVPAIHKNTHCSNRKWCRGNKHLEPTSSSCGGRRGLT